MAIHSYLLEVSAKIAVMVDDSDITDGNFYDQVLIKANQVISDDYFDYNRLDYEMKICGHVKES
jgi:hypothetical protein